VELKEQLPQFTGQAAYQVIAKTYLQALNEDISVWYVRFHCNFLIGMVVSLLVPTWRNSFVKVP
jgi:hypothetical protein